jgi:hypothetical protein
MIQLLFTPPLFGFAWLDPGGCGVVKNSVFPVNGGAPGVTVPNSGSGTHAAVNPPPVPWQPVAHRDAISTQLAFRLNAPVIGVGVPAQPEQFSKPVSTTVNNTTNRPCIWSYRTLALSITQLALFRGNVGHISFNAASPTHASKNIRDVGGKMNVPAGLYATDAVPLLLSNRGAFGFGYRAIVRFTTVTISSGPTAMSGFGGANTFGS